MINAHKSQEWMLILFYVQIDTPRRFPLVKLLTTNKLNGPTLLSVLFFCKIEATV